MCYKLALDQEKGDKAEQRWTGAWISFLLMKMFASIKDSWESFAESLGIIDKEENEEYTRLQRKAELEAAKNVGKEFARYNWS